AVPTAGSAASDNGGVDVARYTPTEMPSASTKTRIAARVHAGSAARTRLRRRDGTDRAGPDPAVTGRPGARRAPGGMPSTPRHRAQYRQAGRAWGALR